MSKEKGGRILYLSRLKALACIAVVVLHSFYAANAYAKTSAQHAVMLSVRNACMWAVPCFVMATGALLLDSRRELGYKKLFLKLILKMAAALVIFTFLFALFDAVFIAEKVTADIFTVTKDNILYGTGWRHMWYLYLMIALYLMMPLYKAVTAKNDKSLVIYACIVFFAFLSLRPMLETLAGRQTAFYICAYSIYPLFVFMGYMLHGRLVKLPLWVYLACAAIGLTGVVILTVKGIGNEDKTLDQLLGSYSFPLTVLMSAGIFGAFTFCKNERIPVIDTVSAELEKCSFGIYLLHMAVLKYIFAVMRINPFEKGGVITVIIIALVSLVISYAAVRLFKLIPFKLIFKGSKQE